MKQIFIIWSVCINFGIYYANSLYLFLGKRDESEIQMCRTFFPKQDKDYAQGQAQYTLLKKEKICLSNHNVEVQYDRLTFKH